MSQNSSQTAKPHKTRIGGQALIEGIMMRGVDKYALAVRKKDGTIHLEERPDKALTSWYNKVPLIRGVCNFIATLVLGYRCMMESAEISGAFDDEDEKPMSGAATTAFSALAGVLAVFLCLILFMVIPTAATGLIDRFLPLGGWRVVVESAIKIAVFLAYMALVSLMSDIKRVFRYHGAEHKTIACYEHRQPLTVENVRRHSPYHPRCGTSFLLIVILVSILVNAFVSWRSVWLRALIKVLLLPLVMGISYEIIRYAGGHDNPVSRAISKPGLWLQRLTVKNPDESMIEVAIAAMQAVLPKEGQDDRW